MEKIIVLHNIISPYRVYLFNEMNNYLKEHESDFKVLFLSESDKNRNWEQFEIIFDYEILKNFNISVGKKDLFTFFINPNIFKTLNRENPDTIIAFGWDNFASYAANYWARKHEKKFILWSGSTRHEPSWRRTLFHPLVKYLLRRTNQFIAYGTRAKEYLEKLGVPENNIQIFYNTVNTKYFTEKSRQFALTDRATLRERLGIPPGKIILFNGQLIERKGIFELLDGFKLFQSAHPSTSLLIVGTGKERASLEKKIKQESIPQIYFSGFIQYNDLYQYYSIADVLILPSREEVWGLVINEALACGLPVIATTVCGASADLIESGKNGYILEEISAIAINDTLRKIFQNDLHKNNTSLKKIREINVDNMIRKMFLDIK